MITADLHSYAEVVGCFGQEDGDGRNLVDAGIGAVELAGERIAMHFAGGLLAEMAGEGLALKFIEIVHEGYTSTVTGGWHWLFGASVVWCERQGVSQRIKHLATS